MASQDWAFNEFLKLDGDGSINVTGVHSSGTPGLYYHQPGGTPGLKADVLAITRLLVMIDDGMGFDAGGYGAGSALTNGIGLIIKDAAEDQQLDLMAGDVVKTNASWGKHCHNVFLHEYGQGNEQNMIRWTFTKGGSPVVLEPGERLELVVSDDMSFLDNHTFLIQGVYPYRVPEKYKNLLSFNPN